MPSTCTLVVNGKAIKARRGDTLLDAALGGRVVLPHDCCSGQCESCRVRVVSGEVDDQDTQVRDTVLGCMATLEGDAVISFDPVPVVRDTRGEVEEIRWIGPELLQVTIATRRPVPWLPGQYVRLAFRGLPPRDYSPTFPLDLAMREGRLVFHVRHYPGGVVSEALTRDIQPGHRVTVRGPFGTAFLRRQPENLVLVSTGTGFAPIWAIAASAVMGQPGRGICVIAGARKRSHLYFHRAVSWLRERGVPVVLTAGDGDGELVRRRRPAELLTFVTPRDVVYAAGAPSQVDAARRMAVERGADFHADPFYAAETRRFRLPDLVSPIRRAIQREPKLGEQRL